MNGFEPTRPRTGHRSPGAILRRLAGAQESILGQVPGERARYSSMGGVVLGTAAVAMVSMAMLLYTFFGTWNNPLLYVLALGWGLFILNLDRWLMSMVVYHDGWRRIVKFLPRIALAMIFGVIIAEPLLLGFFNSAIEQHVRDGRLNTLEQYQTGLIQCNPVPDAGVSAPADCENRGLKIPLDPPASQANLDQAVKQAEELRTRVTEEQGLYEKELNEAQAECAGLSGPGLSGRVGMGPRCRKRYDDLVVRKSALDADETKLGQLDGAVSTLTAQVAGERAAYVKNTNDEIAKRVKERTDSRIGLLERLRAMHELVSINGYMQAAQWALRIFFIVVDSLPVLVKLLSGRTAYDRVAQGQLARQERAQQLAEDTLTYRDAVAAGVRRYEIELLGTAERNRASVQSWWNNRATEEQLQRLVDEGTQQIMGQVTDGRQDR